MKWFKNLEFSVLVILCYLSIIALMGYKFGYDDMTEILSYVNYLIDPDLYPHDLYIQSISQNPLNERTFFAWLIMPGYDIIENWALILHAIFSVILITGLYKVASLYIYNRFFRWLSILISLVLLNDINVGGNELYYNYLVPAIAAKSLGIWVIYRIIKKQWIVASVLIFPLTLFQAIVGAQLLVVLIISITIIEWKTIEKKTWLYLSTAMAPTLAWLLYLFTYHNLNNDVAFSSVSYWDIINFRMPHHYLISHVPLNDLVVSFVLYGTGLYLSFKNVPALRIIFVTIVAGILIYILACSMELEMALQTQWLKTTIWLEFLSVVLIIAWVNQKLVLKIKMIYFFPILLGICLLFIYFDIPPLSKKPYYFGASWANNDAVEIARMAGIHTDHKAVFSVPPDNSTFRYASRRNVFVDFKSIAHNKAYLHSWYTRVGQVYQTTIQDEGGFPAVTKGLKNYTSLSTEQVAGMKDYGINFWLTYKSQKLDLPVLTENETYIVYSLKE